MKASVKALVCALLLNGCSFIPEYEQPDAFVPESWWELALSEQQNAPLVVKSWQQHFQDPTLKALIRSALAHNLDLRLAALNSEIAMAQYGISHNTPQANASLSATQTHTQQGSAENYQARLASAPFELDFFGRLKALNEQALNRYLQTLEAQDNAKLKLISAIAKLYYQLRAIEQTIHLLEEIEKNYQRSYQLVRTQAKNGVALPSQVTAMSSQISSVKAEKLAQKRAYQQALNQLTILTGERKNPLTLRKEVLSLATFALPSQLQSSVLQQRPDVREAEYALRAANANIGAARAALFPSITLMGAAGSVSSSLDNLLNTEAFSWQITPSISLPIFDGGKRKANLKVSELQQQVALENYRKTIQNAFREVADALIAGHTLRAQLTEQTQAVKSAKEALRLEKIKLNTGMVSAQEYLNAERAYYQSQQRLIANQLALHHSDIDLYIAVGGQWVIATENAPTREHIAQPASTEKTSVEKTSTQSAKVNAVNPVENKPVKNKKVAEKSASVIQKTTRASKQLKTQPQTKANSKAE